MIDHDRDARDDEIFMHRVALLMTCALVASGACGIGLMWAAVRIAEWLP